MFIYSRLRFVAAVFIFLLMTSLVAAQEETLTEVTPEVTEEPVVVVEPTPVPEITEEATAAPTDEPTAAPTESTPEVTEEAEQGSETPAPEETDAPTTEPDVPTPEVVSAPPVFEIASSLSVTAGQPLSIPFAVYDEQGAVVLTQIVSAAGAQITLTIAAPVQTSPPFATTGTITYIAAETFSGLDTLTLTAVDGAGITAATTVQIDVQPLVEATEEAAAEVTPEATVEATAEATVEATQEAVPAVERIINYDPAASEAAIQAMLAALNATEIGRIPQLGAMKVLMPQTLSNSSDAMAALHGNQAAVMAGVTTLEENIIYQLDAQSGVFNPNDPEFRSGNQWALLNFDGSINGQDAWLRSRQDGAGVRVAVLDSGVDLQHPDLAGQFDLTRAWDFFNDDKTPDDDHNPAGGGPPGHGTHVAGIIAAKTNNNLFMAGLAYKAKIIPVKVCGTNNDCPAFEVAAGIVHAVDKGAHIINLSLSNPSISITMQGAVQYAISRNVTVIASAGNTGGTALQYPASFPGVISVAAHNSDGNIWSNSTQNSEVDVSGPGVDVYSLTREGGGDKWFGTSSAAAYVTGAAALLYGDNVARTPATIREALVCSAEDAGAPGFDNAFGYGRVQADVALTWRGPNAGCHIPIPNDQFAGAMVIRKAPFSVSQIIHSRNVTTDANDPTDCGTPVQTLWYKFIPPADGRYQISSFGTGYNNRLTVYQGVPGAFVLQGSCDTGDVELESVYYSFEGDSYVSLDMKKGQIYYIVLANTGGVVNDQNARLDIRSTLSADGLVDDNHKAIYYYGDGWARKTVAGSKVMETSTNRQTAVFTFQGDIFDLYRVVGPNQATMEVWINNQRFDFDTNTGGIQNLSNNAPALAIGQQQIKVPNPFYGQQNTVIIRRAETGPSGPIAIDRIIYYNRNLKIPPVTGKIDDRDSRIDFGSGNWNDLSRPGSMFKGTGTRTNVGGTAVRVVVKGSTIVIYRNMGRDFPSERGLRQFGNMEVWVDGVLWGTVSNYVDTDDIQYSVPIVISNLTPTVHLLRIYNPEARELQIDAIEAVTTSPFAPNSSNRPGDKRARQSGVWLLPVKLSATTAAYIADSPDDRLDFNFTGNALCMMFVQRSDTGTVHIYVDDMNTPHELLSTNTEENRWAGHFWLDPALANKSGIQRYCTGAAFVEGVHHVRLLFPSGSPVWLTELQIIRFGVLTSKDGLMQETDRRLLNTPSLYNTVAEAREFIKLWKRIPKKFAGGTKPQGGYVKRAIIDPSSLNNPVIRFYIHGTGFIIYTTRGQDEDVNAGRMRVQVCDHTDPEDCTPAIMTHVIELSSITSGAPNRMRPFAYAVTGLEPGIYLVKIFAEGEQGEYVDFDGVRILP